MYLLPPADERMNQNKSHNRLEQKQETPENFLIQVIQCVKRPRDL